MDENEDWKMGFAEGYKQGLKEWAKKEVDSTFKDRQRLEDGVAKDKKKKEFLRTALLVVCILGASVVFGPVVSTFYCLGIIVGVYLHTVASRYGYGF